MSKKKKSLENIGFGEAEMMNRQKLYAQQEADTNTKSLPKNPLSGSGSTTP